MAPAPPLPSAADGAPAGAPGDAMDTGREPAAAAQDGPSQEPKAGSGAEAGRGLGRGQRLGRRSRQPCLTLWVLTHKGRSAELGHYVAWVKQESGEWGRG